MTRKPPTNDLEPLIKHRQERAKYELGRKPWLTPIGEQLMTVLDSPLRSTVETLLAELAALALLADANKGQALRESRSAEIPIPSFRPVWAEKKLEQAAYFLWEYAETVASFNNRPYDPDHKHGVCLSCGFKSAKTDLCCRHCGRQRREVTE